jgi:hypothetical protein
VYVKLDDGFGDPTEDSVAVQFSRPRWEAPVVAGLRDPKAAPAFLAAVQRWCRGGPEPDTYEWRLVLAEDDAGDLARVALRGVVRELSGPDDAPLPDVTEKLRGRIHGSYLSWAESALAAATGRPAHTAYGLDRQLDDLRRRSGTWPLWVAAPLGSLADRRREGRSYAAKLHLRDAAEAVVRLLWGVLIARAWGVWTRAHGRSVMAEEHAALMVLRTAVSHAFSFGGAVRICGARSVRGLWAVEGAPLPPDRPELWRRLRALAQWRNQMAHGAPSANDDRDDDRHVARLVSLLDGLGPWFEDLEAWLSTARRVPSVDGWSTIAPPGLWEAPNGALCVLEQIEEGYVTIRAPDGARERLGAWGSVAAMLRFAGGGSDIDPPSDDVASEPMEELVAAAFAAIQGGDDVWLVGPVASGRSTLASQVTRALRINGVTVLRVSSTVDNPVSFSEGVRERLSLALRASGLLLPKDGGTARALPASSSLLASWWSAVRELNPSASFALVVDAIDVMGDASLLYEAVRAHQIPTVFVADQPLEGRVGLVLDLLAWHRANDHVLFRTLLRKRYRDLEPEHDRLVAASDGRIGWLISEADDASVCAAHRELTPSESLLARLTRIEGSYGDHPGFVSCLRLVLLTLAETHVGVTLTFMHELRSVRLLADACTEGWSEWLPLALRAAESIVESAWVDDAEVACAFDARSERVWRIANPRWLEFLRKGRLAPEWEHARQVVREALAAHCRVAAADPSRPGHRYAARYGALHRLAAGEDPSVVSEQVLRMVPWASVEVGVEADDWVATIRAMMASARFAGPSDEDRVAVALARALLAAGRSSDALAVVRRALAAGTHRPPPLCAALSEAAVSAALADLRPEEAEEYAGAHHARDASNNPLMRARVMLALERRAEAARLMQVAGDGVGWAGLEVRLALASSGHCDPEPERWLVEARLLSATGGLAGQRAFARALCGLGALVEVEAALVLRAEAVAALREVRAACEVASDRPVFGSADCDLVEGLAALTLSRADASDPFAARSSLAEAWGLVRRGGPAGPTCQHTRGGPSSRVTHERWLGAMRLLAAATVRLAGDDADAGVATTCRMRALVCDAHLLSVSIASEDAPERALRDLMLCDLWLAEALLRAGHPGPGVQLLAKSELVPLVWTDRVLVAALHRAHAAEVATARSVDTTPLGRVFGFVG